MPDMRRRTLFAAGAGLAGALVGGVGLVEARVLPGRIRLNTALGLTGPDGDVPAVEPGPRVDSHFGSRARGVTVKWAAAYPPGSATGAKLPVAVFLHGRHSDHRFGFDQLGLDRFLAAAVGDGVPPFVVVTVDGGPDSYWHRRRDGDDPERMLWSELLPALAERGLRTDRVGLHGFSMGGYGALLFAERRPERVAAVAVAAPALWPAAEQTAPGAFDGPEDFRRHDVYPRRAALEAVPLRIDCGNDDSFAPNVEEFVSGLARKPAGGFSPGAHTVGYLRRLAPAQLRFLGEHLRR
jgi:pimeloyl-ACP methyl ester carboxylesterase